MVGVSGFVRVNNKLIFVWVYSKHDSQEDIDWVCCKGLDSRNPFSKPVGILMTVLSDLYGLMPQSLSADRDEGSDVLY